MGPGVNLLAALATPTLPISAPNFTFTDGRARAERKGEDKVEMMTNGSIC
jgi:hypothetical protein